MCVGVCVCLSAQVAAVVTDSRSCALFGAAQHGARIGPSSFYCLIVTIELDSDGEFCPVCCWSYEKEFSPCASHAPMSGLRPEPPANQSLAEQQYSNSSACAASCLETRAADPSADQLPNNVTMLAGHGATTATTRSCAAVEA